MTEDLKQRLSLAIARARRLEPGKSLLELLESITASIPGKEARHLADQELLDLTETWIIRKKSIHRRASDAVKK